MVSKEITAIQLLLIFFLSINLSYSQELTILHTNDMHSKLTGFGPENEYSPLTVNDDKTTGGFARLATILKDVKAKNSEKTLIVDAGDFLMGSLFHTVEKETGFQLNLMKEIGYDVITLGNHEFDFGPQTLDAILQNAEKRGGYPDIVASNMVIEGTMGLGINQFFSLIFQKIPSYKIIEKNGLKLGVFGLMGIEATEVAPAALPVTFGDQIKSSKAVVDILKTKEKVDLIICLSHSGFYPSKDGTTYEGEDIDLAEKVDGIDILISGHTHVKTTKPIKINDTYIIQSGSYVQNVGKIDLKVDNGQISSLDYKLILVDDKIKGDESIHKKIEDHISYINNHILSLSGLSYDTKVGVTSFDLTLDYKNLKNSNLGPFIADADKYYLKKNGIDVDFSMVASGTIREKILKGDKGIITVPDIFRVMSLGQGKDNIPGYPLAKIYITAKELKKLCEVIIVSRGSGEDSYLFTSGIKIYSNPKKMMLRKVQSVEINGKDINLSKKNDQLYCLTANGYMLSFMGRIKKMTHGLVKIVPKGKNGTPILDMTKHYIDIDAKREGIQEAKEWMAVIEFMKSFKPGDKGLPVIPDRYKKGDESLVIVE